jgi:type IV secretory pathway VirJ component
VVALALVGAPWSAADPAPPPPSQGPPGPQASPRDAAGLQLPFGRFGEVFVYRPAGTPSGVALFVSGDDGWNAGIAALAKHLVALGSVVIGIDMRHYRRVVDEPVGGCQYYGGDFEDLSHEVQRRLGLREYLLPVLVGYAAGAALAYAVVQQSPGGTYAALLTLAFCPDLDLLQPPCGGSGLGLHPGQRRSGFVLEPAPRNATPWVAFQGEADRVCPADATRRFVAGTGQATTILLARTGRDLADEAQWAAPIQAEYRRLVARAQPSPASMAEVRDLPVVEVAATAAPAAELGDRYAILLTGDGGWAGIDRDVAAALAARGVPVAGLNTLRYFWTRRTPEEAAAALGRLIERYGALWNRSRVLLVGYSFGADVLPFLYNRLRAVERARVAGVALLGLGDAAEFEFHLASWIPGRDGAGQPTVPEIERMGTVPIACLYGSEERDSSCPRLSGSNVARIVLPGGHHFGGDADSLVRQILAHAAP